MILLKYYGAGKIGIQLDEPTVQETKMVKRAVDLVGGGTSNLLGLHIHRDNIARFVDLVEGFHVEFDEEVKNLVYEETEVVLDILRQYEERAVRIADHVEMTLGIRPLPHQYEGSRWLVQKKKAILADDPGTGKGHPAGTKIVTPFGYKVIEELSVGDIIIGSDGNQTKVIGVFPRGLQKIYKVLFNDGSNVLCDSDHLWACRTSADVNRKKPYRILSVNDLLNKGLSDADGKSRWKIPMTKPVDFTSTQTVLDGYLLGVLLGDGCLSKGEKGNASNAFGFVQEPNQIIAEITKLGYSLKENKYRNRISYYTITDKILKNHLREVGLIGKKSWEKFIPDVYKHSSINNRLAIIQGLLDTDGYQNKTGKAVELTTTSERLALDFKFIVESLGGQAFIRSKIPTYHYNGEKKNGRVAYTATIRLPVEFKAFRAFDYEQKTKYFPTRIIRSIEYVGNKESICIKVDANDSLYLTENFLVTHNTATTLMALPDNCAVLVEAPAMAIGVWKEHFEQWRPDYKVSVCLSEKKFRMPELGEAIIVSRGSLPPTVKEIQQIQEGTRSSRSGRTEAVTINAYALEMKSPFILIADEAHQFKSAGSLQTQKHRVLVREVVKKGGCVWMVTGTPLLNKPPDLWGVLQSTGCASEIFGGWLEFVRLFGGKQGPFGGYYWPDKHKDIDKLGKEVSEKLKHVMIRHTFEQVRPDLPLKRRHILTIPMDKVKDKKTWKEMEAAFSTLEAAGITVDQMLKMLDSGQASKLPINPFTLRKAMSVAKIPALLELVSSVEDEGEAVIVATAHSAPLEALRSRKGWVIIDGATPPMERKEIERKFQAGQFKGIGLSIQAGGLSLSLHRARRMIFVDLEWTPGENTQVEDRIRRVKQERGCIYTILALDHNYEKKVMTSLINKAQVIDKTINVLAGKDPVYKSDQLSTLVERINGNSNKSISFNDLKNFLWTDMDHHVVFEILSKGIDGITEVEWVFLRNLAKSRKFV